MSMAIKFIDIYFYLPSPRDKINVQCFSEFTEMGQTLFSSVSLNLEVQRLVSAGP
jgi:hypothetical protein